MIHKTTDNMKFKRLVRDLRPLCNGLVSAETIAVGILERLWHATVTNAPQGNIGKLCDEDIAEAVGWQGDASTLVNALVNRHWVDRCVVHRLVIHDWRDHAPNYVKGALAKAGKEFVVAISPDGYGGPKEVDPIGCTSLVPLPNLTIPNLTDRTDQTCEVQPVSQSVFLDWEEEIRVNANWIKDRIDPKHRLSQRNRELGLKVAAMALLNTHWRSMISFIALEIEKKSKSGTPAEKPWGYLKSELIRVSKEDRLPFDQQLRAIEIPAEKIMQATAPPVEAPV